MAVRDTITVLSLLTVAAQAFVLVAVTGAIVARVAAGSSAAAIVRDTAAGMRASALQLAWLVAAVATGGSLYLSEVASFQPCVLCWYQRIAMYPMVLVLGIAAVRSDAGVFRYAVPLAAAGAAISTYHYQLELFPDQRTLSCSAEVPCSVRWVWELGYISIPMMALSAFLTIVVLLAIARRPAGEATGSHSDATNAPAGAGNEQAPLQE